MIWNCLLIDILLIGMCFAYSVLQQMLTSKEKKAVMDDKMKLSEHFIIKLPDLLAKVRNIKLRNQLGRENYNWLLILRCVVLYSMCGLVVEKAGLIRRIILWSWALLLCAWARNLILHLLCWTKYMREKLVVGNIKIWVLIGCATVVGPFFK